MSSYPDYDALAKAVGALALPTTAVTPAIQAKADEIAGGSKNHKDETRKIYDWIGAHIRYVAIELGQGGYVPHSADSVLAHGYGDCKDNAVLFAALLKARGIDSKLVLINLTNIYTVAKVPTLGPFNHMISWLPEFHMYADATNASIVSFGGLAPPGIWKAGPAYR